MMVTKPSSMIAMGASKKMLHRQCIAPRPTLSVRISQALSFLNRPVSGATYTQRHVPYPSVNPGMEVLTVDCRTASVGRQPSFSRVSIDDPLLYRHDSTRTDLSNYGRTGRKTQRIYVATEDLTIVVAGFSTQRLGYGAYIFLCFITIGLAYLLLRWLPHWRVRLIGLPTALRDCTWVVIENQWGELSMQKVVNSAYGHSLSTVFGTIEKRMYHEYDEDDDPLLTDLRFVDYRYIRFYFHPLKDRFILCTNWKDPNWSDTKSIRTGLDSDERYRRNQVFGKNEIDIEQKTVLQLLVDEVRAFPVVRRVYQSDVGLPSFLRVPDCQSYLVVTG